MCNRPGPIRAEKPDHRHRPRGASIRGVSFDHLVGAGKDRLWDRQTERFGGLEIDHQLEPRRLLNR
jgi:hypothetical protein